MSGSSSDPPEWLALADGERVLLHTAPSRNIVLAALTVGFGLLLVMSVGVSAMDDVGTGRAVSLAGLLVIVGLLVAAFLFIRYNEYVLTTERVCTGRGLFSRRVESIDLDDVRDVSVEQSRWQRPVNVGSLRFAAADGDLAFSLVQDPIPHHGRVLQYVDTGGDTDAGS